MSEKIGMRGVCADAHQSAEKRGVAAGEECRLTLPLIMIVGVLFFQGCASLLDQQARYLRTAQGSAHEEEVRSQLGKPVSVTRTNTGDTVWVYQFWDTEKGGNNIWTITGYWCDEYVLTFDKQKILRAWTHKSEKHRDERSMDYCVKGGVGG